MKAYLYSPIYAFIRYDDNLDYYDNNEYWRDDISAQEAAGYVEEINAAIEKDRLRTNEKSGLIDYFRCDDKKLEASIKEKVTYAFPKVAVFDGAAYAVMELETKEPLTAEEMKEIKEYALGQYSDGWGEGFEQREIKIGEGELYVEFWSSSKNYFIDTASEFSEREGLPLTQDNIVEPDYWPEHGMTQQGM